MDLSKEYKNTREKLIRYNGLLVCLETIKRKIDNIERSIKALEFEKDTGIKIKVVNNSCETSTIEELITDRHLIDIFGDDFNESELRAIKAFVIAIFKKKIKALNSKMIEVQKEMENT